MASISSISQAAKAASDAGKLPPSAANKTTETIWCSLLPALDGQSWGRNVTVKLLNVHEQIAFLRVVKDGVQADKKRREADDPEAPQSDEESHQFWESVHLLCMACVEPSWAIDEATQWITTDEVDGIATAPVVQFLLYQIHNLNDEQPGMEDVAAGLAIARRMPEALAAIEMAYLKGGDALDLLLEGKAIGSSEEMTAFIERWGGIISHVILSHVRKIAKIGAEETAEALAAKALTMLLDLGVIKREGQAPS